MLNYLEINNNDEKIDNTVGLKQYGYYHEIFTENNNECAVCIESSFAQLYTESYTCDKIVFWPLAMCTVFIYLNLFLILYCSCSPLTCYSPNICYCSLILFIAWIVIHDIFNLKKFIQKYWYGGLTGVDIVLDGLFIVATLFLWIYAISLNYDPRVNLIEKLKF